jgi:[acyl-carrier-protein] S-malonyltransferase
MQTNETPKNIAFIFPGQGSQSVGMLSQLAQTYPVVKATFDEASTVLDYDLWTLVQSGPEDKLNQTMYTQPALLTASVAIWRIWQTQQGLLPSILAGHSLGEYSALVCAGSLEFTDAVKLVAARGRLMQEAVADGQGAMAAIVGLNDMQVQSLCAENRHDEVLAPVNYNAQGQVVIAGHKVAVERTLLAAKQAGAKLAKLLPVSVPSHCNLMRPAAEKLAGYINLDRLMPPRIPVINNVDVVIANSPAEIKDSLVRQLFYPVQWVKIMQQLAKRNVTLAIECGPGKVLTGLSKRIEPQVNTLPVFDQESLQHALQVVAS